MLLIMQKIFLPFVAFLILFAVSCSDNEIAYDPPSDLGLSFDALMQELNLARTNPKQYAAIMEHDYLPYYEGKYLTIPGEITLLTNEGSAACEEAIAALKNQSAVPALVLNTGLSKACQKHCEEQGPLGKVEHYSGDGKSPGDRMKLFGKFNAPYGWGENIAYGGNTARKIVIQLLIDDGVPDRGHRINIYEKNWTDVGFGWGVHKTYRIMCVMDFAYGYSANTSKIALF